VSVLSVVVLLPLAAAIALALVRVPAATARWTWLAVTVVDLVLVVATALAYRTPVAGALAYEQQVAWIPEIGASYHVGLDGLSLPLVALTDVVFSACAVFALREDRRPRAHAALMLFLQTACLGVFAAQDLIVFFVFFDLSIVGMYFAIAGWGHGQARSAALKFFLYTFLGSLVLLLGFIGLYVYARPHTFDMVELARQTPLVGHGAVGVAVLGAVLVGLLIKTPTVPFHTWLPPAHTNASATGSAVLAGVMLKLGTYGLVRIAMPLLPQAWSALSWLVLAIGGISVLWGALVALGQRDVKRMIAYTSVNHMGYVVLAVGAAGLAGQGASSVAARQLAITGAVTQMVSHGLITTALFLLTGVLWSRREDYALGGYGGLAAPAPVFAALLAIGAFASLGLPGFSGFVAELQVFAGSIALAPVAAVALLGILLTAGLFLRALQLLLTGPTRGSSTGFEDVRAREVWAVAPLLVLALVVGIAPRPLLAVIEPASAAVVASLDAPATGG